MQHRIAKVVRRHQPIRSKLFLDAEIPLMDVWRLELLRQLKHLHGIDERQIRIDDKWKWIASREASPRFLKATDRTGQDDFSGPRRSLFDGVVVAEEPLIEEVSICSSHRCTALAYRVPGETQAWREAPLQPGRTCEGIGRPSGVARK